MACGHRQCHHPPDVVEQGSVGPEPRATGAKTNGQQRQNTDGSSNKRQSHQLLTALLPAVLNRMTFAQLKNPGEPS